MNFLFWEFSLSFLALSITCWSQKRNQSEDKFVYTITISLALKLWLVAVISQTFSFWGRINTNKLFFVAIISFLVGLSVFYFSSPNRTNYFRNYHNQGYSYLSIWIFFMILSFLPLITGWVNPIVEVDSILQSNYIFQMIEGKISPFDFPMNYVALWECSYIPGFILGGSIKYYAFTSLQAIVLFGFAAFLLARIVGMSIFPSVLTSLVALSSGQLWDNEPTGIGTLKNDIIAASGLLLVLLSFLQILQQRTVNLSLSLLLISGLSFISVKFSGLVHVGLILLVIFLLHYRKIKSLDIKSVGFLLLIFIGNILGSGIYYIHNLIINKNPIYPFKLNLGILNLPGFFSPEGTRIIDYIGESELWKKFFEFTPQTGIFTSFFILSIWILAGLLIFHKKLNFFMKNTNHLFFLIYIAFFLWVFFLQTPWSAGIIENPYAYLWQHNSFRYMLGGIQLSLTIIVAIIISLGRYFRWLGIGVLILELIGRLAYNYHNVMVLKGEFLDFPGMKSMLPVILVIFLFSFLLNIRLVWVGIVFILVFVFLSPEFYEKNKNRIFEWGDLYASDDLPKPKQKVWAAALVWPEDEKIALSINLFPNAISTMGSDLQFSYSGIFTPMMLEQRENNVLRHPDIIVVTTNGDISIPESDLSIISNRLNPLGYCLVYGKSQSAIFSRIATEKIDMNNILEKEIELFESFPINIYNPVLSSFSINHFGDKFFATQNPTAIFHVSNTGITRIEIEAGQKLRLKSTIDGSVGNFIFQKSGFEAASPEELMSKVRRLDLNIFNSLEKNDGSWDIGGGGAGQFSYQIDTLDGHKFIFLKAKNDIPWLNAYLNCNQLQPGSYYLRGTISSEDSLTVNIEYFDVENKDRSINNIKVLKLSEGIKSTGVIYFNVGPRTSNTVSFTALNVKRGQGFKIHLADVFHQSWPKSIMN